MRDFTETAQQATNRVLYQSDYPRDYISYLDGFQAGANYGWGRLLQMFKEERNILQNVGPFMLPGADKDRALLMAKHMEMAIKYMEELIDNHPDYQSPETHLHLPGQQK